ncbi:hypothetical protein LCGC14_2200960, partial [marine sediment metagenome]
MEQKTESQIKESIRRLKDNKSSLFGLIII